MGAMSEPGIRRAARFGAPWPTDPLHNIDVMKEWKGIYDAAGEEYGTSDKLQMVLLRDGWVADSMDDVERDWWPCIRAEHWFYFSQIPRWVLDREPLLQGVLQGGGLPLRQAPRRPPDRRQPRGLHRLDPRLPGGARHRLPDPVHARRRRPEPRARARGHPPLRPRRHPRLQGLTPMPADYSAIAELFARYGAAQDLHDRELMATTLTADATVTIHIVGMDSIGPLAGRDTIVSFFGDILDSQTDQRRHSITNIRRLDGRPRQRLPDADRHRRGRDRRQERGHLRGDRRRGGRRPASSAASSSRSTAASEQPANRRVGSAGHHP